MHYAEAYLGKGSRLYQVAKLPWAGDCANLILKATEAYQQARLTVPPIASKDWYALKAQTNSRTYRTWKSHMGSAGWLVSVAGGGSGTTDGGNGALLIADIQTLERPFRIAAGWGAERSLTAQAAKRVLTNDTVVPYSDYLALDGHYKNQFSQCSENTTYYRAKHPIIPYKDLPNAKTVSSIPAATASSNVYIPKPASSFDPDKKRPF